MTYNILKCRTSENRIDPICKNRVNFTGVNLAPGGEIGPLGGMFTPLFTSKGEHSV
jgi:hypothetical protein